MRNKKIKKSEGIYSDCKNRWCLIGLKKETKIPGEIYVLGDDEVNVYIYQRVDQNMNLGVIKKVLINRIIILEFNKKRQRDIHIALGNPFEGRLSSYTAFQGKRCQLECVRGSISEFLFRSTDYQSVVIEAIDNFFMSVLSQANERIVIKKEDIAMLIES